MKIPKDNIVDLMQQQGMSDQADRAQQDLPDRVNPDRDAALLERFGLEPQDVLARLGSGIPGR